MGIRLSVSSPSMYAKSHVSESGSGVAIVTFCFGSSLAVSKSRKCKTDCIRSTDPIEPIGKTFIAIKVVCLLGKPTRAPGTGVANTKNFLHFEGITNRLNADARSVESPIKISSGAREIEASCAGYGRV